MASISKQRIGGTQFSWPSNSLSFQNFVVDANNEGVGWAIQAEDVNAITHLEFRYGARTGTPPTYIIGLESIDPATGFPDGTVLGGGSPASATFTPPADATWDGTFQSIALANSYTPTLGQIVAPVIRYSSGTIDGSNNSSFSTHIASLAGSSNTTFPYALRNTSGTWAIQTSPVCVGVKTASSHYGTPVLGTYNTRTASTVGHRVALEFSLPTGSCSSFKISGLKFVGSIAAAGGKNPILGLWSAAGLLQSKTLDSDIANGASSIFQKNEFFFGGTLATLSPNTTYYIGLQVADAVNGGVLLNGFTTSVANDLQAYAGGTTWRIATYDGSNWTSNTTARPLIELILDDVTGGGGSGGVLLPSGFTGGFNVL